MRLTPWIAMELIVGTSLAAGAGAGLMWTVEKVQIELAREAQAASTLPEAAVRQPVPRPVSPPTELNFVAEPMGVFLGVSDDVLLAPLRDSPITKVKFNRGGSSISLRIDFENGARAAFKPRQTNMQSVPRREVVAFRLNRLLGMSSVPPAIGRQFKIEDLLSHLHPESRYYEPRLRAEMIASDGYVSGELSWWIPVIDRGKVGGYEMDSMEGIVTWKRYLTAGAPVPQRDQNLVRQISDMVLFDFLIDNPDRWSGGNARVSDDGRILYFMDNTMSFGDDMDGHPKARIYLERCQKFSRSLVTRLRNLQEEEVRAVLEREVEPFDFFLRDVEIEALMSRRDFALQYIDGLIQEHGVETVLAFP